MRGIKRCRGAPSSIRLPITDSLMLVIWKSLDLCLNDHIMFWAARTLRYFGFLRSAEFNLASFSPTVHLTVQDISLDSTSSPSCMRVRIKALKTDPFRKGCDIHIRLGSAPLCAIQAVMTHLSTQGNSPGSLFLVKSGQPLTCAFLTEWLRQIMAASGIEGNFSSHSFRIGAAMAFLIIRSRLWVGGPVMHTSSISRLQPMHWLPFHSSWHEGFPCSWCLQPAQLACGR